MRKIRLAVILIAVIALAGGAWGQQKAAEKKAGEKAAPAAKAASSKAGDEAAIHAEAIAWFKAGAAKDADKFASYYAPDANLFPPGEPVVRGKEKITAYWRAFMKAPGLVFSGTPTKIEAAKSGDVAYETGTFKETVNDAAGKPVTSVGKYVVVWKKQPDGKWKAVADIFNTDK